MPSTAVQMVKEMSDVMHETAVSILNDKRDALDVVSNNMEEVMGGKDIITALRTFLVCLNCTLRAKLILINISKSQ